MTPEVVTALVALALVRQRRTSAQRSRRSRREWQRRRDMNRRAQRAAKGAAHA